MPLSQPEAQRDFERPSSLAISAFSGVGLGSMVGALVALTSSPWLGGAVGALGLGLAAVLAFDDRHFTPAKGMRLGAFGLAVLVATSAGSYVRSHRLLSPSTATLAERKAGYLALGLDDAEATELVRQHLSVNRLRDSARPPTGQTAAVEAFAASGEVASDPEEGRFTSGVLAPGLEVTNCRELSRYRSSWTAPQLVASLETEGAQWRRFADRVRELLPADDQVQVLLLARDAVCPGADGTPPPAPTAQQCRQLEFSVGEGGSALAEAFSDAGLGATRVRVERDVSPPERADAFSLLVGVICGRANSG